MLEALKGSTGLKTAGLMPLLGLTHRASFRSNYLSPVLTAGLVEMTDPLSPRSPVQKYRLTAQGLNCLGMSKT
ncbi:MULTISPECIES: Fic family protein [unclassified Pseudomonas]|uniref:Fic family protein n=1 Tax=unclassified Pseudomonas TaxID=196821 RepID=UPI0034CDDB6E